MGRLRDEGPSSSGTSNSSPPTRLARVVEWLSSRSPIDGIPSRPGPGNGGVDDRDEAPEERERECEPERDDFVIREGDTVGEGRKGSWDGDPGVARKTWLASSPLAVLLFVRNLLAYVENAVGVDSGGLDMMRVG